MRGEGWILKFLVQLCSLKKKLSPLPNLSFPIVFRNHETIKTLFSLEKMTALPRFPCGLLLSLLPILTLILGWPKSSLGALKSK